MKKKTEQLNTKSSDSFIVYSTRFARYLAENDIFWLDIKNDRQIKDRFIFYYDMSDRQRIEQLMNEFKKLNQGAQNEHTKNNCRL